MEPFETREETLETTRSTEFYDTAEPVVNKKRKKRMSTGMVILITILCSLAFCAALFFAAKLAVNSASGCLGDLTREDILFSEMEYVRPDEDAIIGKLDDIITCIEGGTASIDEQLTSLQDFNADYYDIYTMYSLATIKHSQDMTDEFFAEEIDFFGKFLPLYSQKTEDILVACAQSPYADTFEAKFFGVGTLEEYKDGGLMTDECVELSQLNADTVNKYLIEYAEPTVEYNGKEIPLYDLLADESLPQTDYYPILQSFYDKYNKIFGEMYVTIVRSNIRIAEELGYDSYIDYIYESYYRDYTPEDAEEYMNDIKEHMVPLFKKLNEDGWYENRYSSFAVTEEQIMNTLRTATTEMGSQFSSIFDYMERNELFDLTISDVKEQISYTTYIYNYDAPYIFINSTGTDSDILTFTHEFGHFAEKYINYGYESGLDCNETASQGIEYLMLSYLDSTLTKGQVNQLYTKKLLETIDVFTYQGYYNEFETRVYSLPYEEVTVENINAIAADCAEEFGLTIAEPWENYYAKSWIEIPHLFQSPFYVISYCTGCDVAIQLYELAEEDIENGVNTYYDLIDWDWNLTFIENVERAGLESPFDDGRIEDCVEVIENYFY